MSTEYLGSFGKLVNSKGLAGIRVGARNMFLGDIPVAAEKSTHSAQHAMPLHRPGWMSKESCMGENGELGWEEHRIPVGVSTEYLEESTEYLVG